MQSSDDLKNILDTKPFKLNKTLLVMVVCVILLIIIILWLTGLFNSDWHTYFSEPSKVNQFVFTVGSVFIGISTGVISAIIFNRVYAKTMEHDENDKIKKIKDLANKDLTLDIFRHLVIYNQRYCKDYKIDASLSRHQRLNGIFNCNVKYEYQKIIKGKRLRFRFVRIENDKNAKELNNEATGYYKYEFFYSLDERSMKNLISDDYKLLKLFIGLNSEEEDIRELLFEKKMSHADSIIDYEAQIPDDLDTKNKLIKIWFEVQYPIEMESYLFFTIELPTNCVKCDFDYSNVKDYIDVYPFDILSSQTGPTALHQSNTRKFSFVKNNWILPRSSFAFIWYKKV